MAVAPRVAYLIAGALALAGCGGAGSGDGYRAEELTTGAEVSVDELAGSPALLVSWATWCRECDEELAGLQDFASSAQADGVRIVAVNLDAADVDAEIRDKIERHGLTVELWRDRRNEFRGAFGALGVPTTVVLDAEGDVVGTFPGAVDFADEAVLSALAEARGR
jgi:peroxiredoxin